MFGGGDPTYSEHLKQNGKHNNAYGSALIDGFVNKISIPANTNHRKKPDKLRAAYIFLRPQIVTV